MTQKKPLVFEHLYEPDAADPQRERPYTGLHSNLLERIDMLEKSNRLLVKQLEVERRTSEDLRMLLAQEFANRPFRH